MTIYNYNDNLAIRKSTIVTLLKNIITFIIEWWKNIYISFSNHLQMVSLSCCGMVFILLYTCIKWQGHGVALNSIVRTILLLDASEV